MHAVGCGGADPVAPNDVAVEQDVILDSRLRLEHEQGAGVLVAGRHLGVLVWK